MAGMLAIANVGRAAAFRSGYFPRNVVPVWINGAARTGAIQDSIRIDINTGEEPHRASFDFKGGSGFVPMPGHTVTIGYGTTANALFAGRILKTTRVVARNHERRPTYQVEAAGFAFEMNAATVPYGLLLTSVAPGTIVSEVLAASSPSLASLGFTAAVDGTLPTVSEYRIGPYESIAESFGRMFRDIDAVWVVDHQRRVRAWPVSDSIVAPATITSGASHVWNVRTQITDLSRVFTRVNVLGARTATVADVDLFTMATAPVQSPEGMYVTSTTGGTGVLLNSGDIPFVLNGVHRDLNQSFTIDLFNSGQASVFLPASRTTNTLTVVSQNVSSLKPIDEQRWYDIGGPIYVSSVIGVYSANASSIAYSYWVPNNGPGALATDIGAFTDIRPLWNKILSVASPAITKQTIVPAGAPLALHYPIAANSTVQSEVTSLLGAVGFGALSKNFDVTDLTASNIVGFASTALSRGEPSQWRSIEFETRDDDYDIARPVYTNISSAAEASASSFTGAFVVQDITLGEFGRLTSTRGPVRSIKAGAVRRPTFWQVLQGV